MKKALLLVSILSISVVTTACINSFAVQELNNKAMSYMEQENYPEAIERLKSSIDLDDSVFESHYNLAVAYTKAEDYEKAFRAYDKAISLKPDFPDTYYSLAVAQEDLASDLNNGNMQIDEDNNFVKRDSDAVKIDKLPQKTQECVDELIQKAIKNYEEYLSRGKDISDRDEVQEHINELKLKQGLTAEE